MVVIVRVHRETIGRSPWIQEFAGLGRIDFNKDDPLGIPPYDLRAGSQNGNDLGVVVDEAPCTSYVIECPELPASLSFWCALVGPGKPFSLSRSMGENAAGRIWGNRF